MSNPQSYHDAISTFHSAIDCEQAGNNREAYKKYSNGLALIGNILKEDVDVISKPVVNVHKHLLEFAKKSTDRLLHILENSGSDFENSLSDKDNSRLSAYAELSKTLPEIITGKPAMPLNFSEVEGYTSPLSFLEAENKRTVKVYEKRMGSLINESEKASLHLELERRLAENEALARRRHDEWEKQRELLAAECNLLAQQKFDIQNKIRNGHVNDADITKQNLYAASLQFNKEHNWANELSKKIENSSNDEKFLKKTLTYLLQHASYPLACMLRKTQEKVLHKLTKLVTKPPPNNEEEKLVLEEHFKNIAQDIKEDLFILLNVIQALWELLGNEHNQNLIIDVLHHLYFPSVKPYLIRLLRVILRKEEEKLLQAMQGNSALTMHYPTQLNPIIGKLHQLSMMHSPTTMLILLVDTLKSFISINSYMDPNQNLPSLSISIDDLMPKLIHLILVSNMSTLPVEIKFVENFMPAKKALGEEGYAVTLFQSVLSYIYEEYSSVQA
ncbi:VPS9 domain-containing protein 1-like [Planococcus citri]|uniref:VPS9 domain-containing protein 1-like n=1 Tax=Planococcus citri TaxID=170843 RepID=UPI0031F8860F